jgi:hypothetical protein
MIRRISYLLAIISLFPVVAISQTKEKILPAKLLYYLTSKDKTRDAIFVYDKNRDDNLGFDKNSRAAFLSETELNEMNYLIKTRVAVYNRNKDPNNKYEYIRSPEKYFKQIIPVINPKGEKEIWVRCSCEVMKDYWQESVDVVSDGGICHFELKINLTKRVVTKF